MKKKRILVTGASGFIGSYLVPILQENNDVVTWDMAKRQDIFDIDSLMGYDSVVHLAALTDVQKSFDFPEQYFWVNAIGTAHMVKLAMKAKTRLIYLSSAAVDEPKSSPYAYSKFVAHMNADGVFEGMKPVILKLFNVYGPGMKESTLLSKFLHSNKLTIYGDGKQTRDFIHVMDVCNIINHIVAKDLHSLSIDVGTGKSTSINSIAHMIHAITNKPIVHTKEVSEIKYSRAKNGMLRKIYPFALQTNLKADIERMIKELN